jgi:hypothetical protein
LRKNDKCTENEKNGDQIPYAKEPPRPSRRGFGERPSHSALVSEPAAHENAPSRRVFGSALDGSARDLMAIKIMLGHTLMRQDAPGE